MADVRDYLDWRGDLTFEYSPFNEIDALALSQFVYLDFNGIIGEGFGNRILFKEACKRYFEAHGPKETKNLAILLSNCEGITKKMMVSQRFKNLQVFDFVDKYDVNTAIQFAAVTVQVSEDCLFVAFRGTDDSLAGWQEDFKLCYMTPVEAQIEAAEYLKKICSHWDGKIILGGHSKGGNLAIYATMCLSDEQREQVTCIYSYDGPGFLPQIVETDDYKKTIKKVITYMPQGSFVGMIMYNTGAVEVVKSSNKGLMQHAVVSWQIMGRKFESDEFENASIIFNKCTKNWVEKIEADKWEQLIDSVFYILKSGEMETFTEMTTGLPLALNKIFRTYADLDKDTKKMMRSIVMEMLKISTMTIKENRLDGRKDEDE